MTQPLAIDLFCGLGGWTEGLIAEGYDVVGFDNERHVYGDHCYPAQLVLQDVLTIHGSQFRNAALIVASPPCQEYSYMAMPWSRAKAIAADYRSGKRDVKELTALFDACFRIQREASEAAGRKVPLVVENVRGAQEWVGRARWSFGSFFLWGDVPALMPMTVKAQKVPGFRFDGSGKSFQTASVAQTGFKSTGMDWNDRTKRGQDFSGVAGKQAMNAHADPRHGRKNTGGSWFNIAHNTTSGKGQNPDGRKHKGDWFRDPNCPTRQGGQTGRKYDVPGHDGLKQPGLSGPRENGKGDAWFQDGAARHGSKSSARKMASAMIAKIPLVLSRHIARVYKP